MRQLIALLLLVGVAAAQDTDKGLTAARLDKLVVLLEKLDAKGAKLPLSDLFVHDRELDLGEPHKGDPLGDAQAASGLEENELRIAVEDLDLALRAYVQSKVSDEALQAAFDKATKDLAARRAALEKDHGKEKVYELFKSADAAREKWFTERLRQEKLQVSYNALASKVRAGEHVDRDALQKARTDLSAARKDAQAAEDEKNALEVKAGNGYYQPAKDASAAEKDPKKADAAYGATLAKLAKTYEDLSRARLAQSCYFTLLLDRMNGPTKGVEKHLALIESKKEKLIPLLQKLDSPLAALLGK